VSASKQLTTDTGQPPQDDPDSPGYAHGHEGHDHSHGHGLHLGLGLGYDHHGAVRHLPARRARPGPHTPQPPEHSQHNQHTQLAMAKCSYREIKARRKGRKVYCCTKGPGCKKADAVAPSRHCAFHKDLVAAASRA
jgi:hypothetical protein